MRDRLALSSVDVVEAIVLLKLNAPVGQHAARAALGMLGMIGAVRRAEATGRWQMTTRLTITALSSDQAARISTTVRAVHHSLHANANPALKYTPAEAVGRLQKEFGWAYQRLIDQYIVPSLIDKGLVEWETRTRLGIFTTRRLLPTDSGRALLTRLRELKVDAESVQGLIKTDPHRAARLCVQLGPALLLASDLGPHFKKLSAIARTETQGTDVAMLIDDHTQRRGELLEGFDLFGAMDWSGVFDAMDAAFDASGGADGSSDGGGGDGSSD